MEKFDARATTSQLYLALLAIPPDALPDELASMIAAGMEHTPYRDEAMELCRGH
ncbi:MAG TPA: hypothetical protein VFI31_14660 [Pirellulales bacterium]|nr:hypothetical protein [Pirellulales bacterium]